MKKPDFVTYTNLNRIITTSGFNNHLTEVSAIVNETFQNIEANLDKPYHLHQGTRATKKNFGTALPNGQRDETLLRHYLIASLFRIWVLEHGQVPTINNKGYPATPFVRFADQIFGLLNIGKVDDHLEEFQSYRKKQFKESGLL